MPDPSARAKALRLLQAKPNLRDLYEGRDGGFYVTYTGDEPGGSPRLDREDIRNLLCEDHRIEEKYHGCYRLRPPSTPGASK